MSTRIHEVRMPMLRLLPGLELRAGAHVDSTPYLVNNDWLSLGAAVSVNLTELFTGPAAVDAAQAGRDLATARREALSMAVLAQLCRSLAVERACRRGRRTVTATPARRIAVRRRVQ